jgi:hypothetical protein
MRKALWLLIFVLVVGCASAQSAPVLVVAKTLTFAWDAVSTLTDGTAIPSGGVVTYEVLTRPTGGTAITVLATTSSLSSVINFPTAWVSVDPGVRAVLTYQSTVIRSAETWASVKGTPAPFVVLTGVPPGSPASIHIQ